MTSTRTQPDPPASALRAFARFLLLHSFVRSWLWVRFAVDLPLGAMIAAAVLVTLAFAAIWHPRTERFAARIALPALFVQLALTFPTTDNHFFLELYAVGLLCLTDFRDDSRALVAKSLQMLAAIALFHTGLQKLLYGQYFSGQFLAFMIGQGERFALPFEWLVSAAEVVRLQSYDALKTGAGPFRVDAMSFVVVSNFVWIAEIALGVLLGIARTRRITLPAAIAAIGLVAAIQLGAREFGFALLFSNLLLLFVPGAGVRTLPAFVVVYLYALAAAFGVVPGGSWIEPGSL